MHRHAKWFAPVVAVLFGLTACEDPTTPPPGTPADVTVRAYVDADGSGDFSAGDPVISGASVTLTPTDGGQTHTATTDGSGVAQFSAVPPGSYVASLDGNVPAGAVLSSAANPVVVVPFQGGQIDAEFRFAYRPGTITGVVYRDDGDGETTPGEGLEVNLFAGESAEGEALATTTTDAEGRFHFGTLRPGIYTVEIVPFGSLEIVDGTTRTFEVTADAATELSVQFVGEFVITVEEARAAASGETVVVEGIVTVPQGNFGREIYVQDETGGISVFLNTGDTGYQLGHFVRVTGTRGQFGGNLQIGSPSVEILGEATVPEPRSVSGAQLNARTHEGELAFLAGFTVEGIEVFSFDNHAVEGTTVDGETVRLYVDSRSGIGSEDWEVGSTYDVTGVLTVRNDVVAHLNPRMPEDVVLADDVEVSTIAEARAGEDGDEFTLEGVVTVDQGAFGARSTYIQDETGGINLFLRSGDSDLGLEIGQLVRVTGTRGTFNDNLQISDPTVTILGTAPVPEPVEIDGSDMLARTFEGQLARLSSVVVDSVDVQSFDNHDVYVTTEDGEQVIVRGDSRTGIGSADWEVGSTYTVTGILTVFRGTPQLQPRRPADVEEL
jgi:DNA/RNA endonuclease YhcR with UshA esterase domain